MRLERETLELNARAIETIPKPRVPERERERILGIKKRKRERERMVSITLESFLKRVSDFD